jgi:phage tail sheath gpL-like
VRDFLNDTFGRWSPSQQLYGGYFYPTVRHARRAGDVRQRRNDQHAVVVGSQRTPTPEWEWAAASAAKASLHLGSAPEVSRPLQTLILEGVLPPRDRSTWWSVSDRQALYADGIAACKVRHDGLVAIDRFVTTYQTSSAGVADGTFRDVETMYQLMFLVRYLRTAVSNVHARQALADENPFNLPQIATPKSIRNTLIHAYNDLVALGVAENADVFASMSWSSAMRRRQPRQRLSAGRCRQSVAGVRRQRDGVPAIPHAVGRDRGQRLSNNPARKPRGGRRSCRPPRQAARTIITSFGV